MKREERAWRVAFTPASSRFPAVNPFSKPRLSSLPAGNLAVALFCASGATAFLFLWAASLAAMRLMARAEREERRIRERIALVKSWRQRATDLMFRGR